MNQGGLVYKGACFKNCNGELTRVSNFVNNLISVGAGREAAFGAALLGDNVLMENAWKETGMLAEELLHAHSHGRPTVRSLVQEWNKMLRTLPQKQMLPMLLRDYARIRGMLNFQD